MSSIRNARRQFTAKTVADIELIGSRLAEAQAALAAVEAEYQERALDAALADDPASLDEIETRLAAARRRVETMEIAASEAQRRESARLAAARDDAEKSRIRAIRQHAGAMVRAAADFRSGLEDVTRSYREAMRSAGKLERLLRREESRAMGSRTLSERLADHVNLEFARTTTPRPDQPEIAPWPKPAVAIGMFKPDYGGLLPNGVLLHSVDPIEDRLRKLVADIDRFTAPSAPAEEPIELIAEPIEADPAPEPIADELVAAEPIEAVDASVVDVAFANPEISNAAAFFRARTSK